MKQKAQKDIESITRKSSKQAFSIALVLGMLLWLFPVLSYADADICQIIDTDGTTTVNVYDNFANALADVTDGQTIQLLANITYKSGIVITGKSVTIDVNGYVLLVEITSPTSANAVEVGAGGKLLLKNDISGGSFNVVTNIANRHGVYAHDGGKVEVSSSNTPITGSAYYGIFADGVGSAITVYGNVYSGFNSAYAHAGGTITVYGYVNGGSGVFADGIGSTATVYGNSGGGGTGVIAYNGAVVYVKGNVTGGGTGVSSQGGSQVTVDGYIRALTGSYTYIRFGTSDTRAQTEYEPVSSKDHYFEYSDGVSYVWVKYFDPGIFTLDIVTHPGNLSVNEGWITESLLCEAEVSSGGTVYYQWYRNTINSNSNGTLISGATSSTFALPTTLLAADSPYYYYCVVSADGVASKTSNAATVSVEAPILFNVVVNGSYADASSGTGEYPEGASVTINAGVRSGFSFTGWTVDPGDVTLAQASSATTTFVMPAEDVTVSANWEEDLYKVVINSSYAVTSSGAGEYPEGATVTINAGVRSGYSFAGWTVDTDNVTLAQANNATTTFMMPAEDVTVTANWEEVPFNVVVSGSYAGTDSGAGEYLYGDTVTLKAGSRSGYTFKGWTVDAGTVTLAQANNATTTFVMPAENVTVTANWVKTTPPSDGGTGTPQTGDDLTLVLCLGLFALFMSGCGLIVGSARKYSQ